MPQASRQPLSSVCCGSRWTGLTGVWRVCKGERDGTLVSTAAERWITFTCDPSSLEFFLRARETTCQRKI